MCQIFTMGFFVLLLVFSLLSVGCGSKKVTSDPIIRPPRVVTLFEPDEKEYDSYAAAISAIEPLRVERDRRVEECMNPFLYWWLKFKFGGTQMYSRLLELEGAPHLSKAQAACNAHLIKSSRVISSMGLEVARFNELSHEIKECKDLQRRVMQQAYLYRVASEMDGEKFPSFENLGKPGDKLKANSSTKGVKIAKKNPKDTTLMRFVSALQKIETCRLQQLTQLQSELGTSVLPPGLCSPELSSIVSPKVKSICSSFELQAQSIIQQAGFENAQFNKLMEQSNSHFLFRWQVNRALQQGRTNESFQLTNPC